MSDQKPADTTHKYGRIKPLLIAAGVLFSTGILVAATRRRRQDEETPAAAY